MGPFRADILCRDTISGQYVLIENQLERTDHLHLGQLLTYAAGLEAVTIVWVASRFTEEHRAALDWLNNATTTGFNFFGLEIELWRIGSSAMAPKFNVVSKPNDWSKSIKEQAAVAHAGQLTESQRRHLEFWTQYRSYVEDNDSEMLPTRPSTSHWSNVPVGRSNFNLVLFNNFRDGRSGAYLLITGPDAKAHYALLDQMFHERIEATLARFGTVKWRPLPGGKESHIAVVREESPADPLTWPALNAWMLGATRALHDLFRPIIRTLDASTYLPPSEPTQGSLSEDIADSPDGDVL